MLKDIIEVKGGFVRAVKIADYFDKELNRNKLESYYPNPEARDAFHYISGGLHPTSRKRAHIISGTYGSGKSHFGLVIANYLTKNSNAEEFKAIFSRISERESAKAKEILNIRNTDKPYLLVLIEGPDPDGIEHALLKGLKEALEDSRRGNLPEKTLKTSYLAAINKIEEWEKSKEGFYKQLQTYLDQNDTDMKTLMGNLKEFKEDALKTFKSAHLKITTSHFEPLLEYKNVSEIYKEICDRLIKEKGFKGIAIIWDQFNDHLEKTPSVELGRDVPTFRDFAESVERSGESQIHLILISHYFPSAYLQGKLSKESRDSWTRAEGRFKQHKLAAIKEMEELISYIITRKSNTKEIWKEVDKAIERDTRLLDTVLEINLCPDKTKEQIKDTTLKGTFPLHPITTYCLPRISDVVGQEARTMFTFFEGTSEGGLTNFINETPVFNENGKLNLYTVDRLFDFFKEAIENFPETRHVIEGYIDAIGKVRDRNDPLTQGVIKILAILDTIKVRYSDIPVLKIPSHLSLMLGIKEEAVKDLLKELEEGKILWKRANGEYEFSSRGVKFNFEKDLKEEKDGLIWDNPPETLREGYPPRDLSAREYEGSYHIRRKLFGKYINPEGLSNISQYENSIKNGYKHGYILYVTAEREEDIKRARELAINIKNPQIAIAIPQNPVEIYDHLKTIKALQHLRKKSPYNVEGEQARTELDDKYKDEETNLNKALESFTSATDIHLFWKGNTVDTFALGKIEDVADIVMNEVFNKTPIVKHTRTANIEEQDSQRINRIRLNSQILNMLQEEIAYMKKGAPPERTILEQTFDPNKMIERRTPAGNLNYYKITEPQSGNAKEVWNVMKKYLMNDNPDFKGMMHCLRSPPYGLCPRVTELFLSAFFREYRPRFEIKLRKAKKGPWEKKEFIGETIYEIVNNPDKTLIEYREHLPQEEDYLRSIMKSITSKEPTYSPLIDDVGKTLVNWFENLPTVTKSSSNLSEDCKKFIVDMTRITKNDNMPEVLFKELPKVLEIVKDFAFWEESDVEEFKAKFVGIINELNGYPETVKRAVKKMIIEVFDVKGDSDYAIAKKILNWYSKILPSVKESTKLTSDEKVLLRYANISDLSQFEKIFVEDMPKKLELEIYLNWGNIKDAMHTYQTKLVGAKKQIEERKKYIPSTKEEKKPTEQLKLSNYAVTLENTLKREINTLKAKLKREEIVAVLNKLLEEFKK